jgi:hypothetical protein
VSAIPWFGTGAGTVCRTQPFHVTADLLPVDATDLYFLENGIVVFTPIERFPSRDAVLNPSRVRASSSLPIVVPIVEPAQNLGETFRHPFGQKTHLTAFSSGLLMIITQESAQSLAALDAPLTIEVPVPRK